MGTASCAFIWIVLLAMAGHAMCHLSSIEDEHKKPSVHSTRPCMLFQKLLVLKATDVMPQEVDLQYLVQNTQSEQFIPSSKKTGTTLIDNSIFFSDLFQEYGSSLYEADIHLLDLIALLFIEVKNSSKAPDLVNKFEFIAMERAEVFNRLRPEEREAFLNNKIRWFFVAHRNASLKDIKYHGANKITIELAREAVPIQHEERLIRAAAVMLLLTRRISDMTDAERQVLYNCVYAIDVSRLIVLSFIFQLPMAIVDNLQLFVAAKMYLPFNILKVAAMLITRYSAVHATVTKQTYDSLLEYFVYAKDRLERPCRTGWYIIVLCHLLTVAPNNHEELSLAEVIDPWLKDYTAWRNDWPPYLWEYVCMESIRRLHKYVAMVFLTYLRAQEAQPGQNAAPSGASKNFELKFESFIETPFMTTCVPDGWHFILLSLILNYTELSHVNRNIYRRESAILINYLITTIKQLVEEWINLNTLTAEEMIKVLHILSTSYADNIVSEILEECDVAAIEKISDESKIHKAVLLGILRAVNKRKAAASNTPAQEVYPSYHDCVQLFAALPSELFTSTDAHFSMLAAFSRRVSPDVGLALLAKALFHWHGYVCQQNDAVIKYKNALSEKAKHLSKKLTPAPANSDNTLDIFDKPNISIILLVFAYNRKVLARIDEVSEEHMSPRSSLSNTLLPVGTLQSFIENLLEPEYMNILCHMLAQVWIMELGLIFLNIYVLHSQTKVSMYMEGAQGEGETIVEMPNKARLCFLSGLLLSKNLRTHITYHLRLFPGLIYIIHHILANMTGIINLKTLSSMPALPPLAILHSRYHSTEPVTAAVALLRLLKFIGGLLHGFSTPANPNVYEKHLGKIREKVKSLSCVEDEIRNEIEKQLIHWENYGKGALL